MSRERALHEPHSPYGVGVPNELVAASTAGAACSVGAMGSVGVPNAMAAGGAEPVFREPWEAQAFAMTVLLHQRGLFTWGEWAQALGAQIASAGGAGGAGACDPAVQKSYYQHWLAALESLVSVKGASSTDELTRYQRAWEHAAHRTPHGQSIDLQPQDLGA